MTQSSRRHIFIPDTQIKPGVPTAFLAWIGEYIWEKRPDVVVHAGDHADMPSLSSYDKGKAKMEGQRVVEDIKAANAGFDLLMEPLYQHNRYRTRKLKEKKWWPRMVFTLGNHEYRIDRAVEADAQLQGLISTDDLNYADHGWEVIPFLEPILIDGLYYSHYFYNPLTGRPYGGMPETRLKNIGHSFVQGHEQTKKMAEIWLGNGDVRRALICGACYLHSEEYKGPQGNNHFRGIFVLNEVRDGNYDLMEVSLNYLCRRYEGIPLTRYMKRYYPKWTGWHSGFRKDAA